MKGPMMSNRWLQATNALICALAMSVSCAVAGTQKIFASPEIGAEALVDSLARNDDAEMRAILGSKDERLLSLDDLASEDSMIWQARIAWLFSLPGQEDTASCATATRWRASR